jgi:hypothetical protein
MNTFIRSLIVSAFFAGVGNLALAQDAAIEPTKGKVLLLKNGHAMEGDIEKVGTQMCIRRGRSQVWIAGDKSARLCADWNDAFAYVRSLVKQDDANDMVKLARWCHLHDLDDKALEQARIALTLQPMNADAKQIVTMLERMKKSPPARPVEPIAANTPDTSATEATVDLIAESSITFTTKIQPILMNTCASCHATGNGGKFHLDRVRDNTQKAATQRNLAAVMAYIDLERPAISPLLTRAITPHGNAPAAAIRDRGSKPFQTMQQWIEMTVARNPQLKDYAAAKTGAPPKRLPESVVVGTSNFASQQAADTGVRNAAFVVTTPAASPIAPRPAQMQSDRYGADQFNKHFHPNR